MDISAVGIDVSKDRLDVALRPSGETFAVERNASGLDRLIERLQQLSPRIVALEATGGFETVVAALGFGQPSGRGRQPGADPGFCQGAWAARQD